jgi:hypothetical protein
LTGHDAPPHLPTTQWKPGEVIVDVHEFEVPTDQPVTLVAGLYLPASPEHPLHLESGSYGALEAAFVASLRP